MSDHLPHPDDSPLGIAARLRAMTPARVGLGRTGVSQRSRDVLRFQLAHAQARDAIHACLEVPSLAASLAEVVNRAHAVSITKLHSAADSRAIYLQRPDLGRRLHENSRHILFDATAATPELVVIVADGLSALAVERHAAPLLEHLLPKLPGWRLAPICIVEQGRVAIGDDIGGLLGAHMSLVLIGERPGLSSPDSLGAYITWSPSPGRTNAERNCISNIRSEGLDYESAAGQVANCLFNARHYQLTGTALGEQLRLAAQRALED